MKGNDDQIEVLRNEGKTVRRVGRLVGLGKSTVSRHAAEVSPVTPKKRGRPRKTSTTDDRALVKRARRSKFKGSRDHARFMLRRRHVVITPRTVRRRLLHVGLISKRPTKKPLLSETHRRRRRDFARGNLARGDWGQVVFVDECTFSLYRVPQLARAKRGEVVITPTVKHPTKVHVWGAISAQGVGKMFMFTENLTSQLYECILRDYLVPTFVALHHRPWILFQDRDPKHSSRRCKDFIEDRLINWLPSPAQSPDLNPLENVWALLKDRVAAHNPENLSQLKRWIRHEWQQLTPLDLRKFIMNMPSRLKAVQDNRGGPTRY